MLRHPSEHGTSSVGKYLLAKAHSAKLNELTEFKVTELTTSMLDKTALAILTRQGSQRISIVSLQGKIRFDIQLDPYWPQWQTQRSTLADRDFETSKFHQDMWNRYHMVGFVSAHIPRKALSHLELRWLYKALRDDLVLPSATTLSNICRMEYALTLDAIRKQLPSRNTFHLALDRWTSTNKVAITSVIAYHMERNNALRDVQLAFDDVDHLFLPHFES